MKERKEGKQEEQQSQHDEKRRERLDKCPSMAAEIQKNTKENRFFQLSVMSIEALESCRKKAARLTNEGRLGG
jgi:hypothetical protein